MSRIIRCDRCRKDVKADTVGYIAWNRRDVKTDDLIDGNPFEHMDFCEKCMLEIKDFIFGNDDKYSINKEDIDEHSDHIQ